MSVFLTTCANLQRKLDAFSDLTGRVLSWLTLAMVLLTTTIVILRHALDFGSVGAQEAVTYLHACVLMLASAYTLKDNGHVRVDIFYRRYSRLQRAWVDLLGSTLFLLPIAVMTIVLSWEFVSVSWINKEGSADPGGLPAIYLLKSLLIGNGLLLGLQAIASILRNLITVTLNEEAQS